MPYRVRFSVLRGSCYISHYERCGAFESKASFRGSIGRKKASIKGTVQVPSTKRETEACIEPYIQRHRRYQSLSPVPAMQQSVSSQSLVQMASALVASITIPSISHEV